MVCPLTTNTLRASSLSWCWEDATGVWRVEDESIIPGRCCLLTSAEDQGRVTSLHLPQFSTAAGTDCRKLSGSNNTHVLSCNSGGQKFKAVSLTGQKSRCHHCLSTLPGSFLDTQRRIHFLPFPAPGSHPHSLALSCTAHASNTQCALSALLPSPASYTELSVTSPSSMVTDPHDDNGSTWKPSVIAPSSYTYSLGSLLPLQSHTCTGSGDYGVDTCRDSPSQILHMDSARAEESDFNDTFIQIWNHAYMTPTYPCPNRQIHLRSILMGQNPQPYLIVFMG